MKVVIAFYGLARSLNHTVSSINQYLISPASDIAEVVIVGHLYKQERIENPRTGEFCDLDPQLHKCINFDELILQNDQDVNFDILKLESIYDHYNDNLKTIKNLVMQLESLRQVTALIDKFKNVDVVIFARPDLKYHDSFSDVIRQTAETISPTIFIPNWQKFGGFNDRFAICNSASYQIFGNRILNLENYILNRRPLTSEFFLEYALRLGALNILDAKIKATRVRANGLFVNEDFNEYSKMTNNFLKYKIILKTLLR